jgi:hypothetical protein
MVNEEFRGEIGTTLAQRWHNIGTTFSAIPAIEQCFEPGKILASRPNMLLLKQSANYFQVADWCLR